MGKESMGFCFVILSVSYFIKYGDLHSYFFVGTIMVSVVCMAV